jgi:hypothetical protein
MAIPSFTSTVIARAAAAIYGIQLGNGTMTEVLKEAGSSSVSALINGVYNRDFANTPNADVAAMVVANLGITGDVVPEAVAYVTGELDAASPDEEGMVIADIAAMFSGMTSHPALGAAASAFAGRIAAAVTYAQTAGTVDRALSSGATLNMTTSQDFLSGTPGDDVITAHIFNNSDTLQSGDQINGGAGSDRLEADLGSSSDFSITPETTSVETVVIRAQARNEDSGDNNVAGEPIVQVDAQRMVGVTRWDSMDSRADLLIEDVRTPLRTKDITIGMVGTDAGNVDYAVYFDRLRADGTSTATLAIELMDTRAATNADPAIAALPLKDSPYNGFTFIVNGKTIRLTDPIPNSTDTTSFNGAQTYPQLLAAIQKLLTDNVATYPELAGITAAFGPTFEARDTKTGEIAVGQTIVLSGTSAGSVSLGVGTFIADDGVPADSGLHTVQSTASTSATDLITSTIVLDDVGRGSNGGDLVVGAMSVGETSSSAGIARFEITVENSSALGIIASTNNALKEVTVTSGAAKGTLKVQGFDNVTSLTAGTAKGDFNNTLPGAVAQHNAYGFNDVRMINMSGMTASVWFDAAITAASFAKYIQLTDTQADPGGDDNSTDGKTTLQVADFEYSGGSANDTIAVVIDTGIAESNSHVQPGMADFTFKLNGNDGNDSISVRIGDALSSPRAATAAETGNDGLINATGLAENWYLHQRENANITIDGGAGNDTIRTPGAGDAKIILGAGNDTVYVDNTGLQNTTFLSPGGSTTSPITNSGRAIWVFNTADQNGADGTNARNVRDLQSDLTLDTHELYRADLTVTFMGLTATVALPSGVYEPSDLYINQAIKKAINSDAVLSKLLVAEDGPLYSLVVRSLIDGVMVDADLAVAVDVTGVASLLSATERAAIKTAWGLADDLAATIQTAMDAAATAFNTAETDYDGKFGHDDAPVDLVGANSTTPSDNTITPGAGNDVMVLGTTVAAAEPESSNDTIVYSAAFDNDTIVNFNDGTAAVGGDILDFRGIGGALAGGVFGVVNNTHRSIVIETQTAANDTAAEVAALFTDAGAVITTAVTHVYVAVDADNVGHVYRVDDPVGATANVTATLMGTIDLADTPWSAVTLADNFA